MGWRAWSIRSTAVLHQHRVKENNNSWILGKPSKRIESRLKCSLDHATSGAYPLNSHLILLSSAVDNWRAYFNDLEKDFLHDV